MKTMFQNLGNLTALLRQAQQAGSQMEEIQQRLKSERVTGTAGAGMIEIEANGLGEVLKVKIDPTLIIPDEAEVLEDLIVAAQNDARAKVDAYMQEESSKMMGGVELPPGFKMPF